MILSGLVVAVDIGEPVKEKKIDNRTEEKYLMIQSSGSCEDEKCEEESSLVLEYSEYGNMDILKTSVPCGNYGGQESITTIYYDKKIMFVLIGNDCTYLGVSYKKGDVIRIPYRKLSCIDKETKGCKNKVTKIEGFNTYNKKDEKLNQTIVFDYYDKSNILYKLNFPTDNEPYLWIQTYNDSTKYTTEQKIDLSAGYFPDGGLSTSVSSDNNRFFFTIWDDTSSLITTFNRNYPSKPFTNIIKYGNKLYTASFPVVNGGIFEHDFYVLEADINNDCDKKCYTISLYNPISEDGGNFVSKTRFERYLKIDEYNPTSYPIYQIYGIGNMLYLPHSEFIYEIDISLCYTIYLQAKNIAKKGNIVKFNDSGSFSIFEEKLYSIASNDRKKLSYWKQNEEDSTKSKWVVVSDNPYGTSMSTMISDIKQGIVIPEPLSNLEFKCQNYLPNPESEKKSRKVMIK